MANSIRTAISPLLIINYIFGLRIIEFPADHLRIWFGLFYMLLLWSVYHFLLVYYTPMFHLYNYGTLLYTTSRGLNIFTVLLSTVCGIYHNKRFRNCLKKIIIVDATLEKLGIMTDHQYQHKKIVWVVIAWSVIVMLMNCTQAIHLGHDLDLKAVKAVYLAFILNYCSHLNLIGDLTITSIIGYIGLKFEQINKQLQNMASNKRGIKRAWENAMLHLPQCKVSKAPSSKWMIRILIHLHLELRKISRDVDWIFGIQMTFKMGSYFFLMTEDLIYCFQIIFLKENITNYLIYLSTVLWLFLNILKLLIINCICEKVSTQANSTKHFINEVSFSICDVEMCENISQLLLHIMQSPLKFRGIGLFQFGNKFINGFIKSIGTVVVVLIQVHVNK